MKLTLKKGREVRLLALILFVITTAIGLIPPTAMAQSVSLPPLPDPALLTDPVFARPGYAQVALPFAGRTRYLLSVEINPAQGLLYGRARVLFVNRTGGTLSSVIFRLYPNHPVHGNRQMKINSVQVNGAAAAGNVLDPEGTVYEVPLSSAIPSGSGVTFDFEYTISLPGGSFYYLSEPLPLVAVYDYSGWRQEVATKGLDYAYNESALFAVNLRAPTEVQTRFVGALKGAVDNLDGTTTYTIVTGPVRNLVIIQARGWGSFELNAAVPIHVLYSGDLSVAQQIGEIAVNAFNYFDANFGAYPYAAFDLVVMRFPSGGEEYPSLVFVNNAEGFRYRRFITAHEVAHQWFYGIAGNDILRNAWLDESLVQVASYLMYLKTQYGSVNAAEEYWTHVMTWYNRIQVVRPINTALEDFTDFADYMSTIYGGGAVFMRELAETMGVDAFIAGLGDYVRAVNLEIGSPCGFYFAMQNRATVDLRSMFRDRVGITC
ncbi:MAG: hypothetical protein IT322_03860 [Anaerolineae bacterium]|nr:hypothetical protein [Anaerolineae bacterium]